MTDSGDHGGDSTPEVEAGLFVYGSKLGFEAGGAAGSPVSQVDLVPTISLLLGVPVPFSNLGMMIQDLFIPTMLIKDGGAHARLSSFSSDNLLKFRMSYMKSNVHQAGQYIHICIYFFLPKYNYISKALIIKNREDKVSCCSCSP